MTITPRRVLPWIPRVLGIMVTLFIGLFALDAFSPARSIQESAPDFLVHLLPAVILLIVVALSWRREWIGAVVFIGLALFYSLTMASGRTEWILLVAGPLSIVGVLFLYSWLERQSGRGVRNGSRPPRRNP
jgi:hypothetical protein